MRLTIARSFRRVLDQARYSQLLKSDRLSPAERLSKARAARQPDPPGIHCEFCGEVKLSFEAACPNDGPDWPHPRSAA